MDPTTYNIYRRARSGRRASFFIRALAWSAISAALASPLTAEIPELDRPDTRTRLVIDAIDSVPTWPAPDEPTRVRVTISNLSRHDASDVTVRLHAGTTQIASRSAQVPAGRTRVLDFPWTTPAEAGVQTLTATLSGVGLRNGKAFEHQASRDVPVLLPGLDGSRFSIEAVERLDEPARPGALSAEVANRTSEPMTGVVAFRRHGDVMAWRMVRDLAPGESRWVDMPFAHHLTTDGVSITPGLLARESKAGWFTGDPGPNLRVDRLTSHYVREPGGISDLTFAYRVINDGELATDSFRVLVETPLATRERKFTSLEPGEAIYVSEVFAGSAGTVALDVIADSLGEVTETDESDNAASSTVTPGEPALGEWVSIGPRRIDYGLGSVGRMHAIAIDPSDPQRLYVGGPSGNSGLHGGSGIWATDDGGASWHPAADAFPSLVTIALATDPQIDGRVYALTDAGLFRSPDYGTSWRRIAEFAGLRASRELVLIDPDDSSTLYVTSRSAVYRSTDEGVNWQPLPIPAGTVQDLIMMPGDASTLYLAITDADQPELGGLFISDNAGASWQPVSGCSTSPLPVVQSDKTSIRLAVSGLQLYARYRTGSSVELYRSQLGTCAVGSGAWEQPWQRVWAPTADIGGQLWRDIYTNPSDPKWIYAAGTNLWVSDDFGATFTMANGPHVDHQGFAVDPVDPSVLYTATDGGLYRSSNHAESWTFVSEGVTNVELYDIAVAEGDPELTIGGTQDNGTVVYEGGDAEWHHGLGGDGAHVDIHPSDDDSMIAGGQNANIALSENRGQSFQWGAVRSDTLKDCFNPHFELVSASTFDVLESCGSLWWLDDWQPGTTPNWQEILVPANEGSGTITVSAVDPGTGWIYAGSQQGEILVGGPGAWPEVYSHPGSATTRDLEIDPQRTDHLYAVFGGGTGSRVVLLERIGSGAEDVLASDITSDLPAMQLQALVVDRMRPWTVLVGGDDGIYRGQSSDEGTTWVWTPYARGLPNAVQITELESHPVTGVIRAGTFGRGAYEVTTDSALGSVLQASGRPTFLRVHEVGVGYGPPGDRIDGEVVVQLDTMPGFAFGFPLRADTDAQTHAGTLALLRDATARGHRVTFDYVRTGFRNGQLIRLALTR